MNRIRDRHGEKAVIPTSALECNDVCECHWWKIKIALAYRQNKL